jgi:hypothetical protein
MTHQHAMDDRTDRRPMPGLSRGVYGVCYYLAFGSVYAGHLAMEFLPPDGVVRQALHDGAEAARLARARAREEQELAEREMALPDEATDPAGGA